MRSESGPRRRRGRQTQDLRARFWAKVDKRGPFECWPWMGSINHGGYGKFWVRGSTIGAHRVAYELTIGPIPDGLQLDHVKARGCTRKDCVNPGHLEPVTPKINTHRRVSGNAKKATCPQGHPYDEANTYRHPNGGRKCRTCQRNTVNRARKRT